MNNALTRAVFGRKLNQTYTLANIIDMLNDMDMLHIGELAEQAISKKAKVALCEKNCPNIDTVTGKQIKHAQTHPERGVMKAWFSVNSTAPILLVVTENLTKKQYYFHIPYKVYCSHNGNAISIPFNNDGTPKSSNKWWKYKINNFNDLCNLAK